ncbi:MAG: DUF3604 domain-containing protein, partial [Candidatus Hydrogenedentes bacterium]|nr:DUF3604 domain-containing protein [Candidatus Hydrogenedentota bacterium]
MRIFGTILTAILVVALSSQTMAQTSEGPDRKAMFGELHIHTQWSFDAYYMSTRRTPEDAYEFAKGKPMKHSNGQTYQISRPLDFMAVTDHGMFLGVFARIADPTHPLSELPIADKVTSGSLTEGSKAFGEMIGARSKGTPMKGTDTPETRKEAWDYTIAAANRHNDPGTFTAFIAYEWTSTPDGQNLHRNVIFKGDTAPPIYTRLESQNPEDLWTWMDGIRGDGHDVLAIPHNVNLSDGRAFEREDSFDNPFTQEYADTRNRNEPLVEVSQIKGTSEAHPALSPNDEFADFGLHERYVAVNKPITNFRGGYVRYAYGTGLEIQDGQGFNPYRFGLIAATDSHSGIVPVEENNYSGPRGEGPTPEDAARQRVGSKRSREFGSSGLAGVWSKENTRESIFESL